MKHLDRVMLVTSALSMIVNFIIFYGLIVKMYCHSMMFRHFQHLVILQLLQQISIAHINIFNSGRVSILTETKTKVLDCTETVWFNCFLDKLNTSEISFQKFSCKFEMVHREGFNNKHCESFCELLILIN